MDTARAETTVPLGSKYVGKASHEGLKRAFQLSIFGPEKVQGLGKMF
jgi:hypothetical protein